MSHNIKLVIDIDLDPDYPDMTVAEREALRKQIAQLIWEARNASALDFGSDSVVAEVIVVERN